MSQPLNRLALVGPLPPPSGGMANQTRQLHRLLKEAGIDVQLVQVNAPYRPAWVAGIRGVRALFRLVPYLVSLWRTAGNVELMHVLANSGWSWHLFTAPAVWIAAWRGTPVVINYRGGEAETFFRRSFRWVEPTLRRATAVVVPSAFLEDIFARRNVATVVVPNIIDLSRFHPATGPRNASAWPHMLITRNLEAIYDIDTALRVFRQLCEEFPDAVLTVAGTGPEEAHLRQLADELGIASAVSFVGRVDNEEIPKLYRSADLMLNTSLIDNMPISLLEALASGVPVVSTDAGGIPHLVAHDVHALLAPCGDVNAVAFQAIRLLRDESLRRRLVEAGKGRAAEYEWDRVRAQWFAVYEAANEKFGGRSQEVRSARP